VVVADIDGEVATEAAAAMERPGRAEAATLDVTDEAATRALLTRIGAQHGGLHALFANAAILAISPFEDLTLARFREVVAVNTDGALVSAMAAAPALRRAGGGNILVTVSIMGAFWSVDTIPYSTAKDGVIDMVRCLACDLAGPGIVVNGLAPGFIETRMARLADVWASVTASAASASTAQGLSQASPWIGSGSPGRFRRIGQRAPAHSTAPSPSAPNCGAVTKAADRVGSPVAAKSASALRRSATGPPAPSASSRSRQPPRAASNPARSRPFPISIMSASAPFTQERPSP
jgi:NAD(P)-dependent dehydrogenase (short-subunit alcohol dehydrogenase family)